MRQALNWAIVALIALGFWALPGGDATLQVVLTLLSILFFAVIALLGYRLYREHRFTIDSLEQTQRIVLYGSIGLAFLTFVATDRLWNEVGSAGVVIWLALLGLASYGVFWVFTRYRRYE